MARLMNNDIEEPSTMGPDLLMIERHTICHSDDGPFKCDIDDCRKTFDGKTGLTMHMESRSGEQPFECAVAGCGKAFKHKSDLKKHTEKAHSGKSPLECPVTGCDRTCENCAALITHIEHHSTTTMHECTVSDCEATFKDELQLARHTAFTHSADRPFKCTFTGCYDACKNSKAINPHITRHRHIAERECTVPGCDRVFEQEYERNNHLSPKQGIRNERTRAVNRIASTTTTHNCADAGCDKAYKSRGLLTRHVRQHSTATMYKGAFPTATRVYTDRATITRHQTRAREHGRPTTSWGAGDSSNHFCHLCYVNGRLPTSRKPFSDHLSLVRSHGGKSYTATPERSPLYRGEKGTVQRSPPSLPEPCQAKTA